VLDFILIAVFALGGIGAGLYFLNKWAYKKMSEQQDLISRTSQTTTIYVIDKKKEKPADSKLPKLVLDQLPKRSNFIKMPLVTAKVGPQIITFICDKNVYDALPIKKSVKVDISGIYITNMKGMKSPKEMKALAKEKKAKAKEKEKEGK